MFLINPKNVIWVNFLEDRQWEGEKFSKFNVKFIDGSEKELFFKENELDDISFHTKPAAIMHPMDKIEEKDKFLKGFLWRGAEQPKRKADIFNE